MEYNDPPTLYQVLGCIAYGHAAVKHLEGFDPDSDDDELGVNEFTNPKLGGNLGVETREELHVYLQKFFKKQRTKGFYESATRHGYVFYNEEDNVLVVLDKGLVILRKGDMDLGTVYRPDDRDQTFFNDWLDEQQASDKHNKGAEVPVAETPEDIEGLVGRFIRDLMDDQQAFEKFCARRAVLRLDQPLPEPTSAAESASWPSEAEEAEIWSLIQPVWAIDRGERIRLKEEHKNRVRGLSRTDKRRSEALDAEQRRQQAAVGKESKKAKKRRLQAAHQAAVEEADLVEEEVKETVERALGVSSERIDEYRARSDHGPSWSADSALKVRKALNELVP